jgi:hypothetical protein
MLSSSTTAPSTEDNQLRWQPGHMPHLSYRNAALEDRPDTLIRNPSQHDSANSSPEANLPSPTVSVRPSTAQKPHSRSSNTSSAIRPTTAPGRRTSTARPSAVGHAPTKKRGSLFSGLFVKEPSSIALEHLAQKLMAEHGELSARAIPGVSSATIPRTVPKVNSKWDGRPASRRLKDSRGSEARGTKSSSSGSSGRSRSADPSERDYASSRGNRPEPWQFSSTSSVNRESSASQFSAPQTSASVDTFTSSRKGSMSANAPGKMPRPHSARSQSLRSPSGSSLPQITSFFPDQIPDSPALPPKPRIDDNAHAILPIRSKPADLSKSRSQISITLESLTGASLDNMSSHSATFSEASPATPLSTYTPIRNVDNALSEEDDRILTSFVQPKPEEVVLLSSGKNVLGPPAATKRKVTPSAKAFLAGEARPLEIPDGNTQDPQNRHQHQALAGSSSPVLSNVARVQQDLEKRPDSSRARLGLRASMLVDADAAPVLSNVARVQQDLEKRPDSSRARLGLRASMLMEADTLPWQSQENIPDGSTASHRATVRSLKIPTSPKPKPKGFGIFGRDKAEK